MTGRLGDWPPQVAAFGLDVLDLDAAVALLLERTAGRRPTGGGSAPAIDGAPARELAGELDGLALALEYAAAYMRRQRLGFADYLERWRRAERAVDESGTTRGLWATSARWPPPDRPASTCSRRRPGGCWISSPGWGLSPCRASCSTTVPRRPGWRRSLRTVPRRAPSFDSSSLRPISLGRRIRTRPWPRWATSR